LGKKNGSQRIQGSRPTPSGAGATAEATARIPIDTAACGWEEKRYDGHPVSLLRQ
jgi:hypothetical protein